MISINPLKICSDTELLGFSHGNYILYNYYNNTCEIVDINFKLKSSFPLEKKNTKIFVAYNTACLGILKNNCCEIIYYQVNKKKMLNGNWIDASFDNKNRLWCLGLHKNGFAVIEVFDTRLNLCFTGKLHLDNLREDFLCLKFKPCVDKMLLIRDGQVYEADANLSEPVICSAYPPSVFCPEFTHEQNFFMAYSIDAGFYQYFTYPEMTLLNTVKDELIAGCCGEPVHLDRGIYLFTRKSCMLWAVDASNGETVCEINLNRLPREVEFLLMEERVHDVVRINAVQNINGRLINCVDVYIRLSDIAATL